MRYAVVIRCDLVAVLVVGLWDRSVLYEIDWINCTRGWMDDLVSVIILLRSWNNIPLPVGFRHRGRQWHINPDAVIEDQRVWSNRNSDRNWVKVFYPMKKSMIGMQIWFALSKKIIGLVWDVDIVVLLILLCWCYCCVIAVVCDFLVRMIPQCGYY